MTVTAKRSILFEVVQRLDPAADNSVDSDGDGWADWKERLAGTDADDMSSVPATPDDAQTSVPMLFEATVTLGADLPCPVVMKVGRHMLVLLRAGSWTLTLKEGEAHELTLAATQPCAVGLSVSLSSPYASLQTASGVFSGGAPVPGGAPAGCGLIAQPVVSILPNRVCFHSDAPKTVSANVSPPMAGLHQWVWAGGGIWSASGRWANICWDGGSDCVYLLFTAEGASAPRRARRQVTRCTRAIKEHTWCNVHRCEHWFCACDNPGASEDDSCAFHGQNVSECWKAGSHTNCVFGDGEPSPLYPDEDEEGGGGLGPAPVPAPGEPAFGSCGERLAAVNNDDDDMDGAADSAGSPVAGENDLAAVWPLGLFDGQCCPCPEHRPQYGTESAEIESGSARLALWADAAKTHAFGATVHAGEAVWVEGLSPSPAVNADRIVWRWTDENNRVHRVTNAFTVLSVRLFGDVNLDGQIGAADRALHPGLSPETGWAVPAATNVFRPVRLRTDVGLSGGVYTLSLSKEAKDFADAFGDHSAARHLAAPALAWGRAGRTS